MSTYIGKNSKANSPLIITKGSHSISDMKASVVPADTIFSTTLPFLECEVFDLTNLTLTNNGYFKNVWIGTLSTNAINYVSSRLSSASYVPVILYAVNGTIVNDFGRIYNAHAYIWDFLDTDRLPDSGYINHCRPFPTSTYKHKAITWSGQVTDMKMIVLSLDISNNKDSITNTMMHKFSNSNELLLHNNSIIVNNVNLASLKYITLKNISAKLTLIGNAAGDTISIPNYKLPNKNTELHVTPNRTYIKNSNNEYLFDTNIGYVHFKGCIIPTIKYSSGLNNYYVDNFIVPPNGGGIIISTVFPQYYSYNASKKHVAYSSFYVYSTIKTSLAELPVTASDTTYLYTIYVDILNGIKRIVLGRELIYLGTDGNLGFPPTPNISCIGIL